MIGMDVWIFLIVGTIGVTIESTSINVPPQSQSSNTERPTIASPRDISNLSAIEELSDKEINTSLGSALNVSSNVPSQSSETDQTKNYSNCRDVRLELAKSRNKTGGVFEILVPGFGSKEVYCNTVTDGGNWIVFQRRMDGSVNFDRLWNDYVKGFGQPNGEIWLGLEVIHKLTKLWNMELRIDITAIDGTSYYAKYKSFKIGPVTDNYRMSVSGYSGNATDSFANPPTSFGILNNQQFSTEDNDNDQATYSNCAAEYKSGWWFNKCYRSNLNGYFDGYSNWIHWYYQVTSQWMKLKFTEMKIRETESDEGH